MRNIGRNAGAYIALIIVIVIFAALSPEFRQPSNLLNVLDQAAEIAVVAVGMTAVILTAGIDLSVGSIAALAPFLGAWLMTVHPAFLGGFAGTALAGIIVALTVGALIGAINGLAIVKAYVPPFIVTLGMMSVARGLAYVVSRGSGISSGIPPAFMITAHSILTVRIGERTATLTVAVIVMVAVYVVGHLILSRTSTGRAIYAIGGNEAAARLSGLPVNRILMQVYIAAGVLAALGGLMESATVGGSVPQAGMDLELNAIAAVVIGGTSLFGGRGSLAGTFAGALLMRIIRNGLNLTNVDSNWQRVVIGAIIVLAVAFDERQKRRTLRA